MWRNVSGGGEDGICGVALAVAEPVPVRPALVIDMADDRFDSGAPSYLAFGLRGEAVVLVASGLVSVQSVLTITNFASEAVAGGGCRRRSPPARFSHQQGLVVNSLFLLLTALHTLSNLEKLNSVLVTPEHIWHVGGKMGLINDVPKSPQALALL
jgi:hypothetical protein